MVFIYDVDGSSDFDKAGLRWEMGGSPYGVDAAMNPGKVT